MTRFVMIQGIIGAFCVRIPVAFFMSRQVPVSMFHMGLATSCATILQAVIACCASGLPTENTGEPKAAGERAVCCSRIHSREKKAAFCRRTLEGFFAAAENAY